MAQSRMIDPMPFGAVLACTGDAYLPLAIHTARSLAATNPGLPIDLFADRDCDDPVFAAVHTLDRITHRPKFEAIRRSRFERTLYLDTDIRVLADVSDLFALLERVEIAGAFDAYRASRKALDPAVPAAFPQINSGVLAVRQGERTAAAMKAVEDALAATGARKDQPILRRILWETDLVLGVLPEEYNLMAYRHAALWSDRYAAPRIVHNSRLSKLPGADLDALAGARLARHIRALVANDPTLPGGAGARRILPLADRGPQAAGRLWDKLRLALRRMIP